MLFTRTERTNGIKTTVVSKANASSYKVNTGLQKKIGAEMGGAEGL